MPRLAFPSMCECVLLDLGDVSETDKMISLIPGRWEKTHLEGLEEVFACRIFLPLVNHRVVGEIGKSIMGVMFVVEQDSGADRSQWRALATRRGVW
jgi:hypothetical protein